MKKLLLFIFIVLSATAHTAEHPDSITVYGRVVCDDDTCIGAHIYELANKKNFTVADIDGLFKIKIPNNSYIGTVYVGYAPKVIFISETDSIINNFEIKLEYTDDAIDNPTLLTHIKVDDANGNPIPGVDIRWHLRNGKSFVAGTTNSDGIAQVYTYRVTPYELIDGNTWNIKKDKPYITENLSISKSGYATQFLKIPVIDCPVSDIPAEPLTITLTPISQH